MRHDPGKISNQ